MANPTAVFVEYSFCLIVLKSSTCCLICTLKWLMPIEPVRSEKNRSFYANSSSNGSNQVLVQSNQRVVPCRYSITDRPTERLFLFFLSSLLTFFSSDFFPLLFSLSLSKSKSKSLSKSKSFYFISRLYRS